MGFNEREPTFLDASFSEVTYNNISSKVVLETAISDFQKV